MMLQGRIVGMMAWAALAAVSAYAKATADKSTDKQDNATCHVAVEPDVAVGVVKPVNGVGQPFFRLGVTIENWVGYPGSFGAPKFHASGTFEVYLSVGEADGTPVYELPIGDDDGQRRYKIGRITL